MVDHRKRAYIIKVNLDKEDDLLSIVCTPPPPPLLPARASGGRGLNLLPNVLDRISIFRGGLLGKRRVTFFRWGAVFT